jgi:hypothetical protein
MKPSETPKTIDIQINNLLNRFAQGKVLTNAQNNFLLKALKRE